MKNYWFILGNFPLISTAEILAVLSLKKDDFVLLNNVLRVTAPEFDAKQMMKRVGGTIKIGEAIQENLNEEELTEKITEILKIREGKINFGISFYGNDNKYFIKNLAIQIKQNLRDEGKNGRFVFKNESTLSSVTVDKNRLTEKGVEFLITEKNQKYSLGKTLAVQPFEDFGERDFGRPGRDKKSGMLPPKLALMMINLTEAPKNAVFMDPFCGSGTILTEALLQDYTDLLGADISERAISDTQKNLTWTKEKTDKNPKIKIFLGDAQKISAVLPPACIDTICAEPFLGQPLRGHEPIGFLRKQSMELKQLYLAAFGEFKKVLKKNGCVIFIIPRFKFGHDWITIDCQKELAEMGFRAEPFLINQGKEIKQLLYHRADQKVGREIWKFRKVNGQ